MKLTNDFELAGLSEATVKSLLEIIHIWITRLKYLSAWVIAIKLAIKL